MKRVKLFESFVNESKEEQIAQEILQDLLGEYDPWELSEMQPEEARETVDSYGHKGSKAKKIAEFLYDLAQTGQFESKMNESKFKVGKTYNWHGAEWDPKAKENVKVVKPVEITKIEGNKVYGRFEGNSEEYIIREPEKYLKA